MRVASCLATMSNSGGIESNAVRTAEALDSREISLTVFALQADGPMRERYERAGVSVIAMPPVKTLIGPRTGLQVVRFARVLHAHRIEVVHCHDPYTNWVAGLAARLARVPLLTSKRWIDAQLRHLLLSRVSYRLSSRVLANSNGVARTLVDEDRVPERRIVVVPNFVEDAAFEAPSANEIQARRAAWGIGSRHPVIGCVARLRPEKGHEVLLRAAAQLVERWPNLAVVLVGDGPEEVRLRALATELRIVEHVCFTGHLPNRPNPNALFDISVLTSDHEGFPNTILEAMAAARPVVASNIGGVPDAVRDEVTGLLTPPQNAASVASALARLLAAPDWASALGARGQAIARSQFTRAPVIEQLTALYRDVAGRSGIVTTGAHA